jgi:hypothetical protein
MWALVSGKLYGLSSLGKFGQMLAGYCTVQHEMLSGKKKENF